jgi:hypothetical protein
VMEEPRCGKRMEKSEGRLCRGRVCGLAYTAYLTRRYSRATRYEQAQPSHHSPTQQRRSPPLARCTLGRTNPMSSESGRVTSRHPDVLFVLFVLITPTRG